MSMSLDGLNISLLKKLTIIIPTFNRQMFMVRSMEYWSGKHVNIIYIDGSKKPLNSSYLTNIKSNIKYIHKSGSIYERLFSIISLIDTEFVMLGCDDEFYIPKVLNSCLVRLSLDSHLVSCMGIAIGFNWYNNSVVGYHVYNKLNGLILNDINPASRLIKHFSNYVPAHIYAVCRASIWKIAAKFIFSKEYNFFAAYEIQFELILVYSGKSLVIKELMWMRSEECPPQYATSKSLAPSLTLFKFWFDEKNSKEKEDFVARTEAACKEINKLKKENYTINIKVPIETHLRPRKNLIFFIVYRNLPNFIRNLIKKIFKIFGNDVTKKTPLINLTKSLEASGVAVDFKEIKIIEKKIISFYKNIKNFNLKF